MRRGCGWHASRSRLCVCAAVRALWDFVEEDTAAVSAVPMHMWAAGALCLGEFVVTLRDDIEEDADVDPVEVVPELPQVLLQAANKHLPCHEGYRATRDTVPCGIPCRAGYRAGWDTVPGGISCRAGQCASWDTESCCVGYRAVRIPNGRCGRFQCHSAQSRRRCGWDFKIPRMRPAAGGGAPCARAWATRQPAHPQSTHSTLRVPNYLHSTEHPQSTDSTLTSLASSTT